MVTSQLPKTPNPLMLRKLKCKSPRTPVNVELITRNFMGQLSANREPTSIQKTSKRFYFYVDRYPKFGDILKSVWGSAKRKRRTGIFYGSQNFNSHLFLMKN